MQPLMQTTAFLRVGTTAGGSVEFVNLAHVTRVLLTDPGRADCGLYLTLAVTDTATGERRVEVTDPAGIRQLLALLGVAPAEAPFPALVAGR